MKAERVSGPDSTAAADAGNFLTQNGNTLTFSPDRNYTGSSIYYRITITSVEVGSKSVINFVQDFEKESKPVDVTEENRIEAANGSGSDGGAGGDTGSESNSGSGGETP